MKKILIVLLSLLLIISFASCTCEHFFVQATCTSPKTCAKCRATQGEALGHNFEDATCTRPKTCSRCGKTEGSPLGHTVTCASNEPCSRCGKKVEHSYKGNIKTGYISCVGCGNVVNKSTINKKPISELTTEEKAYVQWVINYYMTALDSSGKYLYTTDGAYAAASKDLGYSSAEMKSFWNSHVGMSPFNSIYT